MRRCVRQLTYVILFCLPLLTFAQTDRKSELQKQKVRLQDEIDLANRILKETRASKQSSLGSIETVEQKLKLRENLIRTIDRETELLSKEIEDLEVDIDTLEAQVMRLKEEYAQMIRHARKSSDLHSRLMFLFSSKDFNQAIRRLEYLKQYSEFRRRQVEEIQKKESDLSDKVAELNEQRQRKEKLRGQMQDEKARLIAEKEEQQESIAQLQEKESQIEKELKEKQVNAKKLENEIQRIIAAEMRRAKEKAIRNNIEEEAERMGLVSGKDYTSKTSNEALKALIEKKKEALRAANKPVAEAPKTAASPSYNLTPEASRLASNFAANKSLLPWPVERGIVIGNFGPQRHPIAKSVVLNNNGIDIATERGSKGRAAFDGEVTSIIRIPGEGIAVIVSHGNYFTLYSYFTEVYVKSGDKVNGKQELGVLRTNDDQGQTVMHFELWKESQALDPLPWLAGK